MTSLDDAEKAYDIACLYHDRGDISSMIRWMKVYEEFLRDARTSLKTTEDQQVRLVDGNSCDRVVSLSSAGGFHKVMDGKTTQNGALVVVSRK